MFRLIIGGSGGQGVVSVGKLLAGAAMDEGLEVTCYPVYGAEMRGGYAFASLIFAREQVFSPIITRAEAAVFLSSFAFTYLRRKVKRGGIGIVNSDLVGLEEPWTGRFRAVPFVSLAREAGDERCANMVAAGYLSRLIESRGDAGLPFPSLASLRRGVPGVFPGRRRLWEINRRALLVGYRRASEGP